MRNSSVRKAPFWKMAFRLGGVFVLVVITLRFFYFFIKNKGSLSFVADTWQSGKWLPAVIYYLIIGLAYGITMTLIMKNNARK